MIAGLMVFLILLLLGTVPVFISLSFASVLAFVFFSDQALVIVVQRLFAGIDKFALMAVPFFIFGANIMKSGGIARRILDWARTMVGARRGGIAMTTELACLFFGSVSGSSPATVVAIGGIMHPALKEADYPGGFSAGLVASSGSVALLIPPSISAIVYGAVTGASVGALFMAGIGAGILYGLFYMAYIYWFARKHKIPGGEPSSTKEKLTATKRAALPLGIPAIILGGIYGGVFTPTEAAGVATVYALIVSMLIYKELDFKGIYKVAVQSAEATAQVMVLLGAASVFGWIVTVGGLPQAISTAIIDSQVGPLMFLLLINILLLVTGMFIDGSSAIVIVAPLLYPVAMQLGIDAIHLGVIMVACAAIGMFTPPFGLNLFVAVTATEEPLINIMKGVTPFVVISIIALVFITYIPDISLTLPRFLYPYLF